MTHCVHCLRPAATWFRVVSCIYFFFLEAGLTCIDSFLKLTTKIIGINLFLFVWYYPAQCKVLEIFSNSPSPPLNFHPRKFDIAQNNLQCKICRSAQ